VARNDNIINKPDPQDINEFDKLLNSAMQAKRQIERGFIELARSILTIHKKKLYKVKYETFEQFCNEELGFSRQTIYIYIGILKLITSYPEYFPEDRVINFGHKKMRHITEGTNAIDKNITDIREKEDKKIQIFKEVTPDMSSTEIEEYIDNIIADLV